jgi:hypothetical protein
VISTIRMAASAVLLLSLAAGAARAQDIEISAFYGNWQGNAVSESNISVYFRLTNRDIGVTVQPISGGFTLSWNTVQRQRGNPDDPKEVLKATKIDFHELRPGVWQGSGNRDPLSSSEPYAWAFMEHQTLVVNLLQIRADGEPELQVYRRTLNGAFMELEFTRVVDGRQTRTAKGRLIKIGN